MHYKLEFEQRDDYFYVYVEVYLATYEVLREYCQKIAAAAAERAQRRVLVEKAPADQLSTIEAYKLASELPALGFARVKLAFVDQTSGNDDLNNFTEMVGNNRGMLARTFGSVKDAETWLLST